jgi:hypothetical protein
VQRRQAARGHRPTQATRGQACPPTRRPAEVTLPAGKATGRSDSAQAARSAACGYPRGRQRGRTAQAGNTAQACRTIQAAKAARVRPIWHGGSIYAGAASRPAGAQDDGSCGGRASGAGREGKRASGRQAYQDSLPGKTDEAGMGQPKSGATCKATHHLPPQPAQASEIAALREAAGLREQQGQRSRRGRRTIRQPIHLEIRRAISSGRSHRTGQAARAGDRLRPTSSRASSKQRSPRQGSAAGLRKRRRQQAPKPPLAKATTNPPHTGQMKQRWACRPTGVDPTRATAAASPQD